MSILSAFPILLALSFPPTLMAAEMLMNDYRKGLSSGWEEKSFKGSTRYEITQEDGQPCIQATSQATASALYYRIEYDPKEYPILAWRWKVKNVIEKGNAFKKEGDDYAARVYVVFPSALFWRTRAINYLWANKLPLGQATPNPFTANAMMVAVQSGPAHVGQWKHERRNVLEDYRKFFGEDPSKVGAVAIMTDTDNTGEAAVAWYGPIRILSD